MELGGWEAEVHLPPRPLLRSVGILQPAKEGPEQPGRGGSRDAGQGGTAGLRGRLSASSSTHALSPGCPPTSGWAVAGQPSLRSLSARCVPGWARGAPCGQDGGWRDPRGGTDVQPGVHLPGREMRWGLCCPWPARCQQARGSEAGCRGLEGQADRKGSSLVGRGQLLPSWASPLPHLSGLPAPAARPLRGQQRGQPGPRSPAANPPGPGGQVAGVVLAAVEVGRGVGRTKAELLGPPSPCPCPPPPSSDLGRETEAELPSARQWSSHRGGPAPRGHWEMSEASVVTRTGVLLASSWWGATVPWTVPHTV